MGLRTEQNILTQLKKAQGETNQRLDAIIEQLRQLNLALQSSNVARPADASESATAAHAHDLGGVGWRERLRHQRDD